MSTIHVIRVKNENRKSTDVSRIIRVNPHSYMAHFVLHTYEMFLLINPCSPRAQGVLFTFSRPKGLKVVSSVEISADFENPFLKKICVERFSEI